MRRLGPRILRIARKRVDKLLGRSSSNNNRQMAAGSSARKARRLQRKQRASNKASSKVQHLEEVPHPIQQQHRAQQHSSLIETHPHHNMIPPHLHHHHQYHPHQQLLPSRSNKIGGNIYPNAHHHPQLEYHPHNYYYHMQGNSQQKSSSSSSLNGGQQHHYYFHGIPPVAKNQNGLPQMAGIKKLFYTLSPLHNYHHAGIGGAPEYQPPLNGGNNLYYGGDPALHTACCRNIVTDDENTVAAAVAPTTAITYPVGEWVSKYEYFTGVIRSFSQDVFKSLLKVNNYGQLPTTRQYDDVANRGGGGGSNDNPAEPKSSDDDNDDDYSTTTGINNVTTRRSMANRDFVTSPPIFTLRTSERVKQVLMKAGKWRTDCEKPIATTTTESSTVTGDSGSSSTVSSKHWFTERWSPRFSYDTGTWDVRKHTPTWWPMNPTAVWSGRYFTHLYTIYNKNETLSPMIITDETESTVSRSNITTPYVTGTYNRGNQTKLWSGRWFSERWSPRFRYDTGTWDVREHTPTPWPKNPTAIWSGRYFTQFYTHNYKNMTISPYTIKPKRTRKQSTTTEPSTAYRTGTYNYGNITGLWSGRWFSEYPYPDLTTAQWFDA